MRRYWFALCVAIIAALPSTAHSAYSPNTVVTFTAYSTTGSTLQLPNTNNLVEEINQGTKSAITITLNATSLSPQFAQCVADNGQNFYLYNMTVVTSDGSTINGQTGSTGIVLNNLGETLCFLYDGIGNWIAR